MIGLFVIFIGKFVLNFAYKTSSTKWPKIVYPRLWAFISVRKKEIGVRKKTAVQI